MRIINYSMFRRLAILLAFVPAFASCRVAYDSYMTSRLGTTEYYRWDIKSLDTVSIYNFRILDKGAFKMEEGIDTTGMAALKISDRQSALGASSMRAKHRDPAKPDEKADNNERVSRLLYRYVQENRADGYKVSWADWLSTHGG